MRFVLVLHSHMPWVLTHGRWPHGADWLSEAVLDTYRTHRNVVDGKTENFIDTLRRVGQDPFKLAANAARTSTARAPRVAAEA